MNLIILVFKNLIGDLQKQAVELKAQVQKLEQDNARQEGQVST